MARQLVPDQHASSSKAKAGLRAPLAQAMHRRGTTGVLTTNPWLAHSWDESGTQASSANSPPVRGTATPAPLPRWPAAARPCSRAGGHPLDLPTPLRCGGMALQLASRRAVARSQSVPPPKSSRRGPAHSLPHTMRRTCTQRPCCPASWAPAQTGPSRGCRSCQTQCGRARWRGTAVWGSGGVGEG